jgi:hypothetical protein
MTNLMRENYASRRQLGNNGPLGLNCITVVPASFAIKLNVNRMEVVVLSYSQDLFNVVNPVPIYT